MTKQKRIDFNCTDFEAMAEHGQAFGRSHMALTANLCIEDAEELLYNLATDIGFKRVWELLETELNEARQTGEESWSAPQDPGHGRSMKWGDPKRG